MRTTLPFFLLATILHWTTPNLDAAVFHLLDGTEVTGAIVEEGDGWLVVLDADGKQHTLEHDDILAADLTRGVDEKLERKAKKARKKLEKARKKKIAELLKDYAGASAEERREIDARLREYPAEMRLPSLEKAVRSKKSDLREYALEQLSAIDTQKKVIPLVVSSLVVKKDEAFVNRAHAMAMEQDQDLTRKVYEYVVTRPQVKAEHRIQAANRIAEIGSPASVTPLVIASSHVYQDIRLTMVNLKAMESVPVNLGSRQQAATQVDIDLPQTEMVQVHTTAIVPVEIKQALQQSMTSALATITGEELGDDPVAWVNWYNDDFAKRGKASAAATD